MADAPPRSQMPRSAAAFLLGVALAFALIGYGALRTPSASLLSLSASAAILLIYALLGWQLLPRLARRHAALLAAAGRAGALAGAIFAAEIVLEYLLLPADNATFGLVEFGLVFLVYAGVSGWLVARRARLRDGVLAAVVAALISSLIWHIALFLIFYLFAGTSRQAAVFRAEGDYEDFQRSGMADFGAFILEDTLGASFFHLLLGPLLAGALGLIGGAVGLGLRRLSAGKNDTRMR